MAKQYKTPERDEKIFSLRQAGELFAAIGNRFGISAARARQIWDSRRRMRLNPRWNDNIKAVDPAN